jgi:O-antigen ligase
VSALAQAAGPIRAAPGLRLAGAILVGGLALAAAVAIGFERPSPSFAVSVGAGIGLLVVLGCAVVRLRAAVALGVALLLVVKVEPAPSDAVFLIAIAVSLATARVAISRVPLTAMLLGCGYLAVNVLSLAEILDPSRGARFSFITFYLVLFGIWLAAWTGSRVRAAVVLRAYVFSAVVSGLLGTLAMLGPLPGRSTLLEYGGTRAVGLFKDPNVFGAFLVPAALVVLDELFLPRLLRSGRMAKAVMFIALVLGIVFSFSRAAWVNLALGLMVMIGIYALRRGELHRAVAVMTWIVAVASVAGVAVAATGSASFLQERAHFQSYDTQRFGAQAEGLRLVEQHPFGVGPGQFELYSNVSAHSTYVRALAEEGVVGFVLLLGLFLGTLVFAARNGVLGRDTYGIGSAPLLGAWVGLLASSFVIDTLHWRHLWLVAALIWAGAATRRREAS